MPSVLRQNGFNFYIYYRDHEPAHTHVFKSGEVVINLGRLTEPPSVREIRGMLKKDVRKALLIAFGNQQYLLERWEEING